ncbi:50S ribosomal protein L22 [termite gut metagenome]|uniref:50S ribosomal protein L22 n=1 Tax=termite gut metagenome TaxID=433724 RepID=A0A5J4STF6_9ZZZZ
MGERKRISAERRKEDLKTLYFARLRNVPTSPRKMRLVVDMIRGVEVNRALGVLKFSSKEAAARVEKLLRSAIANWEQKNERKAEDGELYVSKIFVDGGATLKRMRPAPQGRGHRIRKRSNHVTLFVDTKSNNVDQN